MSLLDTIRKDQLQARKDRAKIKAKLLTTLIGEASIIGKNDGGRETTDDEVVAVVKKFIKNIDESLSVCSDDDLFVERAVLEEYLPPQLSREEMEDIVDQQIEQLGVTDMRGMGAIMKFFKINHEGSFDGGVLSAIVKSKLQ